MTNIAHKKLYRIIALICVIAVLFTSCVGTANVIKVKFDALEYVNAQYSGDDLHKCDKEDYITVATSGLIKLLFDEETATIAVHDTSSDKIWSTLPQSDVTKQISSYPIEMVLSNGDNKVYTLNSQDNSVAFGNFKYSLGDQEVSVTYTLSPDKETGIKDISLAENGDIRADITITYKLEDGSLYVTVGMNHLTLPEDTYLERITILNNFGAYENGGTDDYIFVPDGSGALIMTGIEDKDFSSLSLDVYGSDAGVTKNTDETQCLLGAFGIKNGESAFLCTIEQGDAIASINAERNSDTTLNSVYSSFNVTDILVKQNKNNITKIYGEQYRNEIKLCYRFLSGKLATYSGMATACRENLIRNSVLPARTLNADTEHLPMIISLQGGYVNEKGKYITLTTYEQALSLMTLLKAKGVNNVYLKYDGLHEEANNGVNNDFGEFKKSLGDDSKYEELYSYMNSQKFSLFIDTDMITYNASSCAKAIDGKRIITEAENTFPLATKPQVFLPMARFEDRINNMLDVSENISFDGYSLNDVGRYLYSDYSGQFHSRTQSQKEISSQISVLASSKALMIDTGNFYSVKNASVINNLPITPLAYTEKNAYVGIPFVQMLLHGMTEYSVAPLNTINDSKTVFLKSVEYGCLPSAQWYCTNYNEALDKTYYFNSNINEMVEYYSKAENALGELRSSRITSHFIVQSGVYCTEYDNSIKVYVNYNGYDVTINGVIIGARDCVTIS